MTKSNRFADAMAAPRTLEDCCRAIREMQSAAAFTIPEVSALPTAGKSNQILVLNNGTDAPTINWWDGSAWKQLDN